MKKNRRNGYEHVKYRSISDAFSTLFYNKRKLSTNTCKCVENEIWLENLDSNYEVVRINSNYIHNNEQLDFDIFKTNSVIKQIKKKTLSFKCSL